MDAVQMGTKDRIGIRAKGFWSADGRRWDADVNAGSDGGIRAKAGFGPQMTLIVT